VEETFRISKEELADRPGLEGLRKRMLESVLAYCQEFLEQRRDDPEALADLLDAKQRFRDGVPQRDREPTEAAIRPLRS
jgi:hypothetical protein